MYKLKVCGRHPPAMRGSRDPALRSTPSTAHTPSLGEPLLCRRPAAQGTATRSCLRNEPLSLLASSFPNVCCLGPRNTGVLLLIVFLRSQAQVRQLPLPVLEGCTPGPQSSRFLVLAPRQPLPGLALLGRFLGVPGHSMWASVPSVLITLLAGLRGGGAGFLKPQAA